MAAIGRRANTSAVLVGMLSIILSGAKVQGGRENDAKSQINYVAAALTAGNSADAMTPFSRSFADYDKLASYFAGLTNSFSISNEVDIEDEQNTAAECRITLRWSITLSDLQNNNTEQRSGKIVAKLAADNGKWKIIEMKPIAIFNPSHGS